MKRDITICVDGKNLLQPISGISRYLAITLKYLAEFGVSVHLICPDKPKDEYKIPESINLHIAKKSQYFGPLQWHYFTLPSLVNKIGCDVFWGPAHRLPINLKDNIFTVVTCHDLVCRRIPATMKFSRYLSDRIQLPLSMKRSSLIHAVSKSTYDDICRYYPSLHHKTFSTLPHLGIENFTKTQKYRSPRGNLGKYALFVGTFEPRKNLKNLFKAFEILWEKGLDAPELKLAGRQGWGNNDIREFVERSDWRNKIQIIFNPDDTRLKYLYENCRFLIMPSLHEGLGLPVIEAKNYKKPAIISSGSMEELADDASLIVNPEDPDNIAKAIYLFYYQDSIYNGALLDAENCPHKFDWKINTENLLTKFLN